MKKLLLSLVILSCVVALAQDTTIRKGGGGAGGSATNAIATVRKDGTPIVNGAIAIDFTNAAGTVVTVTADGTTARIGIPQGGGGSTNLTTLASGSVTVGDVSVTNTIVANSITGTTTINAQTDLTLSAAGKTAQRVLYLDVAKKVQTSAGVTPTELEYLDGVTSAIQTQIDGKQSGSFILTNFVLMGISNIVSANANTVLTTNNGVLVITTASSGGSSGTNFSGLVITNATEYTVLNLGTTTNATLPWGTTNHVVWSPAAANGAALTMSGTAGGVGGTNDQTIDLTLIWPTGATALTLPTNGPNGSPVFVMTGPSTNRLKFRYDGYRFWIASGQQPSTGNGYTAVMQTNASLITPTVRYVPTEITGVGGANTNFTLISTQPEVYINGFTNVSIRAVMGYDSALVDYWTCVITNGSGSARTLEFSAVTNNWRFNGVYGTNAPSSLTNATRLEISGRQHGTNVQVLYSYTPWP